MSYYVSFDERGVPEGVAYSALVDEAARGPEHYQRLLRVLGKASLRECHGWACNVDPVISMGTSPLHKTIALKLRAHALRAAGTMLLQVDPGVDGITPARKEAGRRLGLLLSPLARRRVLKSAGAWMMTIPEIKTAVALASLDDARFAELVERDDPLPVEEIVSTATERRRRFRVVKGNGSGAAEIETEAEAAMRRLAAMRQRGLERDSKSS